MKYLVVAIPSHLNNKPERSPHILIGYRSISIDDIRASDENFIYENFSFEKTEADKFAKKISAINNKWDYFVIQFDEIDNFVNEIETLKEVI